MLGVCVRRSENLFVCFGAKPTQRPKLEISHETGSGGGKEGPREERGSVGEGRRREAVDNNQQKEAGEEGGRSEKGVNRSQKGDC